ncbi:VOC family protein [Isachenkonia alkalipeptolytica]|uniref:VOC family protein n=1 Tax=Isachenkonia alkalipeptolytica TaxID=2565777 RepID=A0AA43XMH6_9CLOT|nr:VOC family protein [Isachenkonia alkalipeptolytica]NBG89538.1 VOC family protein [Isachenkonia alkalipeptolytica]
MKKIIPVIWFEKEGEQAAEYYTSIFPNSRLKESVYGPEGNLITRSFEIADTEFSILNGGMNIDKNPSISFTVKLNGKEEIDRIWKELSKEGDVLMPLDSYDFSEYYGWVQDTYGVSWQLMFTEKKEISVVPGLLFTKERYKEAENAIRKYTGVFDNSQIDDLYYYGEEQLIEDKDALMHGAFQLENQIFSAMDSGLDHAFTFNEGISLMVLVDSQKEIDELWDKLSAVAEEERCGWLKDEFGVSWQVVPRVLNTYLRDEDNVRAKRVMDAMLEMKKMEINLLEEAYKG